MLNPPCRPQQRLHLPHRECLPPQMSPTAQPQLTTTSPPPATWSAQARCRSCSSPQPPPPRACTAPRAAPSTCTGTRQKRSSGIKKKERPNQPPLVRLALGVQHQTRVRLEPLGALGAVVAAKAGQVLGGLGLFVELQVAGGLEVGLDLVDVAGGCQCRLGG